ncbi:ABC transporter substrate-binding protein [Candidatus Pelagibacter sp.]|nr:ABC transporter substrate-binding protein [Candidatus Pelagibacter sp.]
MNLKKFYLVLFVFTLNFTNANSIEPEIFVESTIKKATSILSNNSSKESKIKNLKTVAKETVDINGIGLYTLGPVRKSLDTTQKEKYIKLFEQYFLKSFSNRLVDYTNPDISILGKEKLNENYTIVKSLLSGNNERPEVKIDWRIYTKNPDNPLIRDLIIEGLSLARTQKEEFASILNSNDGKIDALFKTLEDFSSN